MRFSSFLRGFAVVLWGTAAMVLLLPVAVAAGVIAIGTRVVNGVAWLLCLGRRETRDFWDDLVVFDPLLGFKMKDGIDCYTTAYDTDPYRLETCEDGYPAKHSIAESDILVVGDSMAAGQGVDSIRSYYRLKSGAPKIKPVACTGYDLVQEYLCIEQLAERKMLDGKIVCWMICTGNDLFDAPRPNMIVFPTPCVWKDAAGEWQVGREHFNGPFGRYCAADRGRFRSPKAMMNAIALFYYPNHVSQRCLEATRSLIGRAARMVRAGGGRLIVLSVPYLLLQMPSWFIRRKLASQSGLSGEIDTEYLDARLEEMCKEHDVHYFAGSKMFKWTDYLFIGDDHLNERGHRKVRKLLTRVYNDSRT